MNILVYVGVRKEGMINWLLDGSKGRYGWVFYTGVGEEKRKVTDVRDG